MTNTRETIESLLNSIQKVTTGSPNGQIVEQALQQLRMLLGQVPLGQRIVDESLYCTTCLGKPSNSLPATALSERIRGCEESGHDIVPSQTIIVA